MSRVLEMIFKNSDNKNFRLSVDDAREDLTPVQIRAAMDSIMQKNIFTTAAGDLVAIGGARVITKEVTEMEI